MSKVFRWEIKILEFLLNNKDLQRIKIINNINCYFIIKHEFLKCFSYFLKFLL